MNILLNGISGFMGREVVKLCDSGYRGASLICGVDPNANGSGNVETFSSLESVASVDGVDCIIDFSHHSVTPALLDFAVANELPLVLCTTGHTDEEIALIHNAAMSIPLFYSGNMSVGIALLIELAKTTAAALPEAEIEIIEKHHRHKVDAPSGTAITLAEGILENLDRKTRWVPGTLLAADGTLSGTTECAADELAVSSIREGEVPGIHSIRYDSEADSITITHDAKSRHGFALGAVLAAEYTAEHQGFLGMSDLFDF